LLFLPLMCNTSEIFNNIISINKNRYSRSQETTIQTNINMYNNKPGLRLADNLWPVYSQHMTTCCEKYVTTGETTCSTLTLLGTARIVWYWWALPAWPKVWQCRVTASNRYQTTASREHLCAVFINNNNNNNNNIWYMLRCVWQALNSLSIHVTFTAIAPGAYPGRPKCVLDSLDVAKCIHT